MFAIILFVRQGWPLLKFNLEDVHILRNAIFKLFRPPSPLVTKKPYKSSETSPYFDPKSWNEIFYEFFEWTRLNYTIASHKTIYGHKDLAI